MLPELHLADWRPTKDTVHLYCQIVGKVRLASTPPRNHWWNAPLCVDVRGLTTRRLHHNDTTFQIDLDFVDHALIARTRDGRSRSFELADGIPVADGLTARHLRDRQHRLPLTPWRLRPASVPDPCNTLYAPWC
jgi:hypothetical protein